MSENKPSDAEAARAARMAKFSIAASSNTANPVGRGIHRPSAGRGSLESRMLFVAWTTFRGAYPRIDDTMLATTWTACNPAGSRNDAYKAKSIGSTVASLNYDGKMSTFFTSIAEMPDVFFQKLADEYGEPIDEARRAPLIKAAQEALAARGAAPTANER